MKSRREHVANNLLVLGGRIEVDSQYGDCCNLHW